MNNENRSSKGRALGFVIASVLATAPTMGCSESHSMEPDAAAPSADASATADGALRTDAASPVDAAAPVDAAVAVVDAATVDAAAWEDDAAYPDAYYPDGIRG